MSAPFVLHAGAEAIGTTDQSSISTTVITPVANRAQILLVATRAATTPNIPTVADVCGVTGWQVIASVTITGSRRMTAFWGKTAAPVAGTPVFDFAGQAQIDWAWELSQSAVDSAAAPIIQSKTDSGTSTAPAVTFDNAFGSLANGVWAAVMNGGTDISAGAGFDDLGTNKVSSQIGLRSEERADNDATADFAQSASVPWRMIAVEVAPAPAGVTVTPGTASIILTGFAPTVSVSDHKRVTPATASISLAGHAPTVTATANAQVEPGAASIVLTGLAPTVSTTAHVTARPGTAALLLTGFAPTVTATANVVVRPGAAAIVLTGFAPSVQLGGNQTVTPGVAAITLTGFAPTVAASNHQMVTPGVAGLTLTGFSPTVTATAHVVAAPGVASLTLTGFTPSVSVSGHVVVTPGTASLVLTGFAPTVAGAEMVTPGTAAIVWTGYPPTIFTAKESRVSRRIQADFLHRSIESEIGPSDITADIGV